MLYPVKDAVFATFSSSFWIMVDWEEETLTWNGEPLWFAREGNALHVGLRSTNSHATRILEDLSIEHWEQLMAGNGRWVEAGPKGLLCSHEIRIESGPEQVRLANPDETLYQNAYAIMAA